MTDDIITISAGAPASDLTPGVYEVTLVDISEPRTIYPQSGPNAGKEVQLRDWTFALEDGTVFRDGKLPVNPSGGLKAKGHPIGATGVSMHALSAMQLCEEAGGIQVKSPVLGGIFNMGGAAVANYVSVLERIK